MGLIVDSLLDVNEGSTPKITGTLYDENDDLVEDSNIDAVTMAIHDYDSGTEIREATALTPSSSVVTSWLTRAETRILDSDLDYEYRVITLVAQYATTKYITKEINLKVLNLRHHSVEA